MKKKNLETLGAVHTHTHTHTHTSKPKPKIKKKIIVSVAALLVVGLATITGMPQKIIQIINLKSASNAFASQEYLEINRNNMPQINVSINDEHTRAEIEITNFPSNVSQKQYRLEGYGDWQDYTEKFTIKENTTIQTRYKNNGEENYTIGSSKVVVDLNYNIELKAPTITLKEGSTTIAQNKVASQNVIVNLSTEDIKDKTIVYEVSITRYPLNQKGLINTDGTINIENVKKAGNEASYNRLETQEDYTKVDESNIKLEKSGIYKIKVKATTNGGFVKSEEIVGITAVDKVTRTGLFNFKTQDGNTYEIDTWTNQNVIVTLNTNSDIAFGNNNITYTLSGATTKAETAITSGTIATITNEGTTTVTLKIKIGATTITTNYNVKIDKTAPSVTNIKATTTAGTYKAGQAITIQTTWNENIYANASQGTITSSTAPTLKLKFGSSTERTATFKSISGNVITYTYTIQSGDNGTLAITGHSGTVYDIAKNSTTVNTTTNPGNTGNTIIADTILPVWTYSSYTNTNTSYPAYASKAHTIKVTFTGTDTNYTSNSLTASDITVKVAGTIVTPTTKTLSTPTSITGGVQYTLTLSGITGNGALTLTIPTSKLTDKAGNVNAVSTLIVSGLTIDNTAPTVGTINVSGTLGNNSWYRDSVTISASGGSDSSGIASNKLSMTSITTHTSGTTVTLTTTDKAGNTSTTSKTIKVCRSHSSTTSWSTNGSKHYKYCTRCGKWTNSDTHNQNARCSGSGNSNGFLLKCSVCGYCQVHGMND